MCDTHACTISYIPVDGALLQFLLNIYVLAVVVDNHQLKVIILGLGIDLK